MAHRVVAMQSTGFTSDILRTVTSEASYGCIRVTGPDQAALVSVLVSVASVTSTPFRNLMPSMALGN